MFCRLLIANLLLALTAAFSTHGDALAAGAARTNLSVQATVLPWLKVNSIQHVTSFQVTADDLRRGYTDLNAAVTVSYQTNITTPIMVAVATSGPEQIFVQHAGDMLHEVRLPAPTASAVQSNLSLNLRVMLPEHAVAGLYPLQLAIVPTIL